MRRLTDIKALLKQLKPELAEKYHVQSIGLFGSILREDFSASSDIDILVDFSKPIGIEFINLADYIEARLKLKVDLVSKQSMKDQYYKAIEREVVYV